MDFINNSEMLNYIKVIGVGGGGSNAVNYMHQFVSDGIELAICNTDNQALEISPVAYKIQLGPNRTEGRGAGSNPEVGREACLESEDEIRRYLQNNTKMLFLTAGMGGGTGTGAAPIIARIAQELDILTVCIVTLPFKIEGPIRRKYAMEGIEKLKKHVDCMLIISNERLKEMYSGLGMRDALTKADDILANAAISISNIILKPGYINVDFADVNTVMRGSGVAIMGSGSAIGDDRATKAIDQALALPLLENSSIVGAKHILLNITTGSKDLTFEEMEIISQFIEAEVGKEANLIFGSAYDQTIGDAICITLIATGFEQNSYQFQGNTGTSKIVTPLDDPSQHEARGLGRIAENGKSSNTRTIDLSPARNNTIKKENYLYGKINDDDIDKEMDAMHKEMERIRKQNLFRKAGEISLHDPVKVAELEEIPAYARREEKLKTNNNVDNRTVSNIQVSEVDGSIQVTENRFLHKNTD